MARQTNALLTGAIEQTVRLDSAKLGVALAEAVKRDATLQSLTIHASHPQMRDDTGAALAKAVKQNSTLQSLTILGSDTQMGDDTGVALAEA